MDPIMALVNTEGFWNSKLKSIIYILKSVFHINRKTLQRIYSSFRSFRGTKTTQEGIILKLKFESHFWSPLKKLFKKFRDRFIERSNFPLGLKGHSRDLGIWPKYSVWFGDSQNVLRGYRIWALSQEVGFAKPWGKIRMKQYSGW